MKQLLEDYKRRLAAVEDVILNVGPGGEPGVQLETKRVLYRTFISELEREIREESKESKTLSTDVDDVNKGIKERDTFLASSAGYAGCHGHRDGDCTWEHCPQLRDNEPHATGRHCPLDVDDEEI